MSKLDYVTIAIVGICIMAILFLVYKMTNVFNGDKQPAKTEIAADSVETEDEDVYDYEIDQNVDSTGAGANSGNAASDKTTATKPAAPASKTTTSVADTQGEDEVTEAVQEATGAKSTPKKPTATEDDAEAPSYSEGKYMVLAGSFSLRESANNQVAKLKKLGYDNARVELFDRGKYAVVLVDRFPNMADAEKLVKKLNTNGVKSYVKAKS